LWDIQNCQTTTLLVAKSCSRVVTLFTRSLYNTTS